MTDVDWLNEFYEVNKRAGNVQPPAPEPEPTPTRWTKADYKALHHLHRLIEFLHWKAVYHPVPAISRALFNEIDLLEITIGRYPARLRYLVAREREERTLSVPLTNKIGTVQVHSANPYRHQVAGMFSVNRWRCGHSDLVHIDRLRGVRR
jgi:hypothetical protein